MEPLEPDPATALFRLRREAGASQKDLAAELRIAQAAICRFERGRSGGIPPLLAKQPEEVVRAIRACAAKTGAAEIPDLEGRVRRMFGALAAMRQRGSEWQTGDAKYFREEERYLVENQADLWLIAPPRLAIANRAARIREIWLKYLAADIDIHVVLAIDLLESGVLEALARPLSTLARQAARLPHRRGRLTLHRTEIVASTQGRDPFLEDQHAAYERLARGLSASEVVQFRDTTHLDAAARRQLAGMGCRFATIAASIPREAWGARGGKPVRAPFAGFIVRSAHPAVTSRTEHPHERHWLRIEADEARRLVRLMRPFAEAANARGTRSVPVVRNAKVEV